MKKTMLLLIGLLLIALLAYFCFIGKVDGIKADLVSKTETIYKDKNMNWVDVGSVGSELESTRDILLTGVAPSLELKKEAEELARGVYGVANVDNQLVVQSAKVVKDAPKVAEPKVQELKVVVPSPYEIAVIKDKDNKVVLNGYVNNANDHKVIVTEAVKLFGQENVTDNLKEVKGSPSMWAESTILSLNKLQPLEYGEFNIKDRDLEFRGYASKQEIKDNLIASMPTELSSDYEGNYFIDALKPVIPEVVVPSPYEIAVIKDKVHKVVLNGYVNNANDHKVIVTEAVKLFGQENVTDNLKEVKGSPSMWAESTILSLNKLQPLEYGEFNIKDRDLEFRGYAPKQEIKDNLMNSMSKELSSDYEVSYRIDAPKPVIPEVTTKETAQYCEDSFRKLLGNQKINFEYNKAIVSKQSYALLDKIMNIAQECPTSFITIEGHTDSDGSRAYNKQLSNKRANAVKSYLIKHGIVADRLSAVGYGELRPIASNKTKIGKAKNRRIELKVQGAK